MTAMFKDYVGEVAIINGDRLFYTLDPAAEGHLWKNYDIDLLKKEIPIGAYCWWLCSIDEVAYNGRRRMI